ncbi:MAG TPA: hypothetical protein VFS17_04910 [Methylophilaceae bacterium]|nr:hypothetical protein [Methylophilaceae bacterium]
MMKTVIGAFEIRSEALQAQQNLLAAGYSEASMEIHGTGNASPQDEMHNDNPGYMQALRSLFAWDLDAYRDEDYLEHYTEAVRRGHVLLSINVDDNDVEQVSDLMNAAGALDIDEKVAQWRGQGYKGGRQGEASGSDRSLNTWAGSDPTTGAVAGNQADSGLDRVTTGGNAGGATAAGRPSTSSSMGAGDINSDLGQGSVPGYQEQGVSAPPGGRHRVHVLPHSNPASRNA